MNKDVTPEVGDVWINIKTNKKIYITGLGNHVYVVSDSGVASSRWYCDFNKLYTYLGKSKVNIEQLFEVEDNGRCIEDNTPHTESTVLFKDLEDKE